MAASILTRLTLVPGCALSNWLISPGEKLPVIKLGTATVRITLLSSPGDVSTGAGVGGTLGCPPHPTTKTATSTSTTIRGPITPGRCTFRIGDSLLRKQIRK